MNEKAVSVVRDPRLPLALAQNPDVGSTVVDEPIVGCGHRRAHTAIPVPAAVYFGITIHRKRRRSTGIFKALLQPRISCRAGLASGRVNRIEEVKAYSSLDGKPGEYRRYNALALA